MSVGAQVLGSSSAAVLVHKQGAGSDMEQQQLKLAPIWDTSTIGRNLTYYTTAPAPRKKQNLKSILCWVITYDSTG